MFRFRCYELPVYVWVKGLGYDFVFRLKVHVWVECSGSSLGLSIVFGFRFKFKFGFIEHDPNNYPFMNGYFQAGRFLTGRPHSWLANYILG